MPMVDVLVRVFDRGQRREAIVEVSEECFHKRCWKPIACIKAAVELGLPFTQLERSARFGLRPKDKERLFETREA